MEALKFILWNTERQSAPQQRMDCSIVIIWMATLKVFIYRLAQHHKKVLVNSFHLNGHIVRCHSQTQ